MISSAPGVEAICAPRGHGRFSHESRVGETPRRMTGGDLHNSSGAGEDEQFRERRPPLIVASWIEQGLVSPAASKALADNSGLACSLRAGRNDNAAARPSRAAGGRARAGGWREVERPGIRSVERADLIRSE